jgi:hypothetical protein
LASVAVRLFLEPIQSEQYCSLKAAAWLGTFLPIPTYKMSFHFIARVNVPEIRLVAFDDQDFLAAFHARR